MGKLTALQAKSAKPKDKQDKLTDGEGLYLLVMPNGSKYWRYDCRYQDKRKTLPLGVYPDVSLSDARDLHAEARRKVKNGIDPTHERKVAKLTKGIATENTFKAIAEEWFVRQMENKSDGHKARARRLLDRDLYPSLGH